MIDRRIAEWLANGDVGSSSKAMMLYLSSGVVAGGSWGPSTPSDCGDLLRCLRLLDKIPEWKSRVGDMANAGGEWPTYVKHWAEMETTFLSEVGGALPDPNAYGWKAPRTYELMKRVQEEARKAANTASQYVRFGDNCEIRFHP